MSAKERLAAVQARIAAACARAGRQPGEVRLLGVSKLHSAEEAAELVRAGCLRLGENYVQEAREKRQSLQSMELGSQSPEWHMIGPLQSNKARLAAELFDWIHTLDRPSLAEKLASACRALGKTLRVLVQVNTSGEDSKSGVEPGQALELCSWVSRLEGLELKGLMCIPHPDRDPEAARPEFQALALLLREARSRPGLAGLTELSMGMSSDLEIAIEEGATLVRVGTALFGPRPG